MLLSVVDILSSNVGYCRSQDRERESDGTSPSPNQKHLWSCIATSSVVHERGHLKKTNGQTIK